MAQSIRSFLLLFYAIGLAVVAARVFPEAFRERPVDSRPEGRWASAPLFLIPFQWVLPPVLILWRIGEVSGEWLPVRIAGLALSVYAGVMLLWATSTLGRFLVPYAAVFPDHELVTTGPYRYVRHPIYSGNLALFLGAALGTLNYVLLALWPLALLGFTKQARVEEGLLRSKFGHRYEGYSRHAGMLWPRFGL